MRIGSKAKGDRDYLYDIIQFTGLENIVLEENDKIQNI